MISSVLPLKISNRRRQAMAVGYYGTDSLVIASGRRRDDDDGTVWVVAAPTAPRSPIRADLF